MSPLAAVLVQTLSPWVVFPCLLIEWWAVWFTLGRNFTTTTLMTLAANGVSLLVSAALVFSGVLGDPSSPVGRPGPLRLALAVAVCLGLFLIVEAWVLRQLMRRLRAGWSWNGYDLATFGAANVAGLLVSAWLVHAL